jgi:small subunit ribosomal protein S17
MENKSEAKKPAKVISTRGMIFTGVVVSTKAPKTAVVAIDYLRKVPKFERVEKRRTKLHVHIPDGMEVKLADKVKFVECRKLSKTKSHIITEVLKA